MTAPHNKQLALYAAGLQRFRNKDGQLSVYAFACGYIQEARSDDRTIEMYLDGLWHVKTRMNDSQAGEFKWDTFDRLGAARVAFKHYCKLAGAKLVIRNS